jgi:hypothetical protein
MEIVGYEEPKQLKSEQAVPEKPITFYPAAQTSSHTNHES